MCDGSKKHPIFLSYDFKPCADILDQRNLESFKIIGHQMRSSNPRKVNSYTSRVNSDKIS